VTSYSIPTLIMASICSTVTLYEFLSWSRRGGAKRDLAFALTGIGATAFCVGCFGQYNTDLPSQTVPWLKTQVMALIFAGAAFLWYVSEITGLVKRQYLLATVAWVALCAASLFPDLGSLGWIADRPAVERVLLPFGFEFVYKHVQIGPIIALQYATGVILIAYITWAAVKYWRSGNRKEGRVLLAVLIMFCAALTNDFAIVLGLYSSVNLLEYAWLMLLLVVGLRRSSEARDALLTKRALEESQAQIERSLREKEVLIRELYHRTKNNMNVIVSLLRLQRNHSGDERLREAFTETESRIMSMSLVHEKLYESSDLSHIDLKTYVEDLAGRLFSNYNLDDDRVSLELELGDVLVQTDTAVSCGLIINELVSNSLKYAFPDGRRGTIRIELGPAESSGIRLVFSDDGVGLPEGFDIERDGNLGMKIVMSLARGRLKARAATRSDAGLSFVMEFAEEALEPARL
jgi:two-component sensor histidine kinase